MNDALAVVDDYRRAAHAARRARADDGAEAPRPREYLEAVYSRSARHRSPAARGA